MNDDVKMMNDDEKAIEQHTDPYSMHVICAASTEFSSLVCLVVVVVAITPRTIHSEEFAFLSSFDAIHFTTTRTIGIGYN